MQQDPDGLGQQASVQPPMPALTKAFLISGLTLFAAILLAQGATVLIQLAVALLVWFLINAVATGIQRLTIGGRPLPRNLALTVAIVGIFVTGFLVLNLVVANLSAMTARVSDFQNSFNPLVNRIAEWAGVSDKTVLNQMFDRLGVEQLFGILVSAVTGFVSQLGVIVVYVIFLLVEQSFFDAKLRALLKNEERREHVRRILERVARDVQSYMWIMTLISALTAMLSYIVMTWIGLEQAVFWAFLIFILNFIPTIGSIIATLFPAMYAFVQFQAFSEPLILLILIGVIQFVVGNLLQPRLAGKTLNMSQFVVILSLFVWGAVWGVVGMFLAVPLTAILMIVFSNFETTRPVAILMSQEGRIETDRAPPA